MEDGGLKHLEEFADRYLQEKKSNYSREDLEQQYVGPVVELEETVKIIKDHIDNQTLSYKVVGDILEEKGLSDYESVSEAEMNLSMGYLLGLRDILRDLSKDVGLNDFLKRKIAEVQKERDPTSIFLGLDKLLDNCEELAGEYLEQNKHGEYKSILRGAATEYVRVAKLITELAYMNALDHPLQEIQEKVRREILFYGWGSNPVESQPLLGELLRRTMLKEKVVGKKGEQEPRLVIPLTQPPPYMAAVFPDFAEQHSIATKGIEVINPFEGNFPNQLKKWMVSQLEAFATHPPTGQGWDAWEAYQTYQQQLDFLRRKIEEKEKKNVFSKDEVTEMMNIVGQVEKVMRTHLLILSTGNSFLNSQDPQGFLGLQLGFDSNQKPNMANVSMRRELLLTEMSAPERMDMVRNAMNDQKFRLAYIHVLEQMGIRIEDEENPWVVGKDFKVNSQKISKSLLKNLSEKEKSINEWIDGLAKDLDPGSRVAFYSAVNLVFIDGTYSRWLKLLDKGGIDTSKFSPTPNWTGDPLEIIRDPSSLARQKGLYEEHPEVLDLLSGILGPRWMEGGIFPRGLFSDIATTGNLNRLNELVMTVIGDGKYSQLSDLGANGAKSVLNAVEILYAIFANKNIELSKEGSKYFGRETVDGRTFAGSLLVEIINAKIVANKANTRRDLPEVLLGLFSAVNLREWKNEPWGAFLVELLGPTLDGREGGILATATRGRLNLKFTEKASRKLIRAIRYMVEGSHNGIYLAARDVFSLVAFLLALGIISAETIATVSTGRQTKLTS